MKKLLTLAALAAATAIKKVLSEKSIAVKPGDMIQWECGGSYVFPEPRKVSHVEDSDMGIFVFVEGNSTGIPIDQVVVKNS